MYFLDVQGTLIADDKSPIKGAIELIKYLNDKNIAYVILTNNSKDLNFLSFLRKLGFDIKDGAYLDPLELLKNMDLKEAASFGPLAFKQVLEKLNIKDDENAKDILLTNNDSFDSLSLAWLMKRAEDGANFIAMNGSSIYAKNKELYPGSGALLAMLSFCFDIKYQILGKPSKYFFKKGLELLKKQDKLASYDKISLISDDIKGELLEARKLGMKSVLVLSGKIKSVSNIHKDDKALINATYKNAKDFLKHLKAKNP